MPINVGSSMRWSGRCRLPDVSERDASAVAIVQARMGSTRLPGKSLADLGGVAVIEWVLRRVQQADRVDGVVLATSTLEEDDPLADMVERSGGHVVRGHPTDVLERYASVLEAVPHEVVVRVTGDCPFVQPDFVDRAVAMLLDGTDDLAYIYTGHRGRLPRGFDVEAVRRSALLIAAAEAIDPVEREHVTPFVARRPDRFASRELPIPEWAQRGDLRLTVDEPADLDAVRAIVSALDASPERLDGREVIELLSRRPDLRAINDRVQHSTEH